MPISARIMRPVGCKHSVGDSGSDAESPDRNRAKSCRREVLKGSVPAPELPDRIRSLPVDKRGFPVPWFAAWFDGEPDFRCVAAGKIEQAIHRSLCWVCGHPLGRYRTFVTGPLCAINGMSAEPPSHRDCAEFSARHCPFLTQPRMRRNDKDLRQDVPHPAGEMIDRNPGVALLWTTRSCRIVPVNGGVFFRVGPPHSVQWFANGHPATRAEVVAALESGLPLLRAKAEQDGPETMRELDRLFDQSLAFVPRE